jgi:hypothetical protein
MRGKSGLALLAGGGFGFCSFAMGRFLLRMAQACRLISS